MCYKFIAKGLYEKLKGDIDRDEGEYYKIQIPRIILMTNVTLTSTQTKLY